MKRCSNEAYARCAMKEQCGEINDAVFFEGSECDKFNQIMEKSLKRIPAGLTMSEDVKSRLSAIIMSTPPMPVCVCGRHQGKRFDIAEHFATHLMASGVTVQEWISVKDGLPKLIPCDASTAYSEAVNVLTSGRKVLTAIWDGFDWICDAEFWNAEGEEITHWTPVLLPLPVASEGG